MNSNSIEAKVCDWFQHRYPDGPQWTSRSFGCFRDAPLELRMIVSMSKVEAEITNGGLPQLLWNVFFHWRHVFADCEAGYKIIAAFPQSEAIRQFQKLFEQHEQECCNYIDRCVGEQKSGCFKEWCNYGYTIMDSDSERLFYNESGVEKQRLDWLRENEARLLQLMAI